MFESVPSRAKLIDKNSLLSGVFGDLRSRIKILELFALSWLVLSVLLGFGTVDNPICLSSRLMERSLTSTPNSFASCLVSQFTVHRRKEYP